MSGRIRIWPVMRAMTARAAPIESEPASPMKIWAGWALNQRKPSRAPMSRAQRSARFGWAGAVEEGDDQEGDEREDERPAGEAVEAVGQVHPVAHGHDREGRERDVGPRLDRDRADERDGDRHDVVGVLDLPRREDGHDDLPQDLLAGPDPVAGPRVQPVVGEAERADEGERRQRREGRGVDEPEQERQRDDDGQDQGAAGRGGPGLRVVALRPVDPDLLGEAAMA